MVVAAGSYLFCICVSLFVSVVVCWLAAGWHASYRSLYRSLYRYVFVRSLSLSASLPPLSRLSHASLIY